VEHDPPIGTDPAPQGRAPCHALALPQREGEQVQVGGQLLREELARLIRILVR
jgi:hypothetical protein